MPIDTARTSATVTPPSQAPRVAVEAIALLRFRRSVESWFSISTIRASLSSAAVSHACGSMVMGWFIWAANTVPSRIRVTPSTVGPTVLS